MMNFNGLKQIIFQASQNKFTLSQDAENYQNENVKNILTLCLTLLYMTKYSNTFLETNDKLTETAQSYLETFKGVVENISKEYISYKDMYNYIIERNINNFLQVTEIDIQKIEDFYENKIKIESYSITNFSPAIYHIGNVKENERERLSKIHFKILNPIVKFYINEYNIKEEDVKVKNISSRIGYEIEISISGIPYNQIYSDIENDKMFIRKYLYKVSMTTNNSVKIIIK